MSAVKKIGKITQFDEGMFVGMIQLQDELQAGDSVHFKGERTDFGQVVEDLKLKRRRVQRGSKGQSVRVRLNNPVKVGDEVYRLD